VAEKSAHGGVLTPVINCRDSIACSQCDDLFTAADEITINTDDERSDPSTFDFRKGDIDLLRVAGFDDNKLLIEPSCNRFDLLQVARCFWSGRVHEIGERCPFWH